MNGRVALACSGIGHVNRGYEASVTELFNAVSNRIDVQLYRGQGKSPGQTCLTTIGRHSPLYSIWPLSLIGAYSRYRNENYSFALHLILSLFVRPVDIVFTPDHCLAVLLKRIHWLLPRRPVIVFSNGAPFENSFCDSFAVVHQKSYEHYVRSEGTELHKKSWLIPNGFDANRLRKPDSFSRDKVLKQLGVDPNVTVVLALSAHNNTHKRVDWLLSEFVKLDQKEFALIIAGQPTGEAAELKRMRDELGCNATFVTVAEKAVPELIWASDMMALCSLSEGFPRAVAEAMGGGKHIFVHPHKNSRWIVGENEFCFVDMEKESALANALQHAASNPELLAASAARNYRRFVNQFTWENVAVAYVNMFVELLAVRQQLDRNSRQLPDHGIREHLRHNSGIQPGRSD